MPFFYASNSILIAVATTTYHAADSAGSGINQQYFCDPSYD
ncbi:MAG TPA: hypothetical protein VFN23_01705 [Ktedonobacteraceae bacterium]|nr:hypothetical protein [Ktedonobacteraceae bacterium]